MKNRILTVPQMIFCEKTSETSGVSLAELMDNAGEHLGREILSECERQMCHKVVILAGKGNNGGDGLVAANFLVESGISVSVILCLGKPSTELSQAAFERLHKDVEICEYDKNPESRWAELLEEKSIVADCIFGTGFHGEIRENLIPLMEKINRCKNYIIACDIPSGADAQNGLCSKATVKADKTVTFHRQKLGMVLSPAKYSCGKIVVKDIKIPERTENYPQLMENFIEKIEDNSITAQRMKFLLPERIPYGHKGDFGKVVSVCGSENYIGAAGISTLAAMRTGAGLVNLCTAEKVVNSLSSQLFECVYSKLITDENGFITFEENKETILEKLAGYSCGLTNEKNENHKKGNCSLLIGCGLGHTEDTEKLVAFLVENSPCPVIIDADGINSLAVNIDVLLKKKSKVILTPHPAELARLCGVSTAEILSDRQKYAIELAKKYEVTVVSKGAETFICNGNLTLVSSYGNTALSKGGSGDMLAGIISSLVAQSAEFCEHPERSAVLGCYIMGKTAQLVSQEKSERGILARDIIDEIPVFLKTLEETD